MIIVSYGIYKKDNIYNSFLKGATEGLITVSKIFPAILGFTLCVSMLKASGFFTLLEYAIKPALSFMGFPSEVLPLAVIRPFSGSGAIAVISDILKEYGTDSYIGKCSALMMGCTETTFYTIAVYFAHTKITHMRHTIRSALCADLAGIIISVFVSRLL